MTAPAPSLSRDAGVTIRKRTYILVCHWICAGRCYASGGVVCVMPRKHIAEMVHGCNRASTRISKHIAEMVHGCNRASTRISKHIAEMVHGRNRASTRIGKHIAEMAHGRNRASTRIGKHIAETHSQRRMKRRMNKSMCSL